jgi:hypothetical protein
VIRLPCGTRSIEFAMPSRAPNSTKSSPPLEAASIAAVRDRLRVAIGSDLVAEFVLGHSYPDVLRELAQNEFDAGGSRLVADFGDHALRITGNGRPVDANGWRRLSVLLSTGRVAGGNGDQSVIAPKTNGIGSKNLGLRSLFLIGDQIIVRSAGYWTLLDRENGALAKPESDRRSDRDDGIEITVPYRTSNDGSFRPFDVQAEDSALRQLAGEIGDILSKLADLGHAGSLNDVVVLSSRLHRRISWTQKVTAAPSTLRGVSAIRRTIKRYDTVAEKTTRRRTEELEFRRVITPPSDFPEGGIAGYYRRQGGRLMVAVSVPLLGDQPNADAVGRCYYPVATPHSDTGSAVSVSAPFLLNADRTSLLEHPWNDWLLSTAAGLVTDLLADDWYPRFGSSAFLAVRAARQSLAPRFAVAMEEGLREKRCWPTRAIVRRSRAESARASDLVIPDAPHLDGFLTDGQYAALDVGKAPLVRAMARSFGAKVFTVNSLVRLRCGGPNDKPLATKTDTSTEAVFHYNDPAASYAGEEGVRLQQRMAQALDLEARHLSPANREDLRGRPKTLAADGTLQAPSALWFVPSGVTGAEHLPGSVRLHPALSGSRTLTKMCLPFKPGPWILAVCQKISEGQASGAERDGVYSYVKNVHGKLPSAVIGAIRRSPVLKDHRGDWVSGEQLVQPSVATGSFFGPALHFPNRDYVRDAVLLKRLRLRRSIRDDEIVAFAGGWVRSPEIAERFEAVLARRPKLSSPLVRRLSSIPFLASTSGGLAAPSSLYIRNSVTAASVGDDAPFVAGSRTDLYRRLGCREEPGSSDIVAHIAELRRAEAPCLRPELVYSALAKALVREELPASHYASEAIVWTESGYVAPADVLVGLRFPRVLSLLPNVRGPDAVCEALARLGAAVHPSDRHWQQLFEMVARRYPVGVVVSTADRAVLREAYERRGRSGLPQTLPQECRCLLSTARTLHCGMDLQQGKFVLNDYPALADAASAAGAALWLADESEGCRDFFRALQPRRLTEVAGVPTPILGVERQAPSFLREDELLVKLHSVEFATAVAALAARELHDVTGIAAPRSAQLHRRLSAIDKVRILDSVHLGYRLGRTRVTVAAPGWIGPDTIVLVHPRTANSVLSAVAEAVASIIDGQAVQRQRLADAIFRVLSVRSSSEVGDYLRSRGIPWRVTGAAADGDAERITLQAALETVASQLILQSSSVEVDLPPSLGPPPDPQPRGHAEPRPLLALELVSLTTVGDWGDWRPRHPNDKGGGSGNSGQWTPPSAAEQERSRAVGNRAEELILQAERARVRALGLDEMRVIWVSASDPGADHDIRSVDEDGVDLWVEVKGTVGTDGRFTWSAKEFARAIRERDRYVLWRVYEADSPNPTARAFRDPIGLLLAGKLGITVANLAAEVAPVAKEGPNSDGLSARRPR